MESSKKRKTIEEILDETVLWIKENGRAVIHGNSCQYITPDGNKCAVGRCLDPNMYDQEMEGNGVDWFGDIDLYLLPEYRGLDESFWEELQSLHDNKSHWLEDNTLSDKGKKKYQEILSNFTEQ